MCALGSSFTRSPQPRLWSNHVEMSARSLPRQFGAKSALAPRQQLICGESGWFPSQVCPRSRQLGGGCFQLPRGNRCFQAGCSGWATETQIRPGESATASASVGEGKKIIK